MADSQRKTANLYNTTETDWTLGILDDNGQPTGSTSSHYTTNFTQVLPQTIYYLSGTIITTGTFRIYFYDGEKNWISRTAQKYSGEFITPLNCYYIRIQVTANISSTSDWMLNEGATALPYEPYGWVHSLRKLTTATEAIENPLYSDGTAITSYTIKGNTVQNGTPTPSNPVPVVGVGELETTGEHTGEYKIPILNGQQTTNIYLGSVQSNRQIKKVVFDGSVDESWSDLAEVGGRVRYRIQLSDMRLYASTSTDIRCTHYNTGYFISQLNQNTVNNCLCGYDNYVYIYSSDYATLTDFKAFLTANPITVYYVLATPETAAVNEPLMKIGDYADTLSNATAIPTTDGANSITVDTTVQPSEFTATWTGWHDSSVKEYDGSQWQ